MTHILCPESMAVKATTRSRRCHPIPGPEWRSPPGPCLNRPLLPMNLRHHSGLGEMKNPTPRQRTTVRGCRLCLDHDGTLRRSPYRVPCVVSCLDCLRVRPAKWRRSLALKRIEPRMWIGLVPLALFALAASPGEGATHADCEHGKQVVLWPDGAPGAERSGPEDTPSLTPYFPDADHATGTAIIVNPGGGYRGLAAVPNTLAHL